ncbi:MAG: acetyl-CoA synthase subunit gamma [Chitinivibrionales bacterium]|nr:acetyl-CoA synthase subunit gamma [Chitinivibrionales bacterium]MBD3357811.1 acetyl-CoA synthase subunit gamma [Chitinivibrionales bacterium]
MTSVCPPSEEATMQSRDSCCCASIGTKPIQTDAGLNAKEMCGDLWCRFSNSFRMKYTVAPGLYKIGNPTSTDPVLLSANYRLSFNALRKELKGLDLWIMVLNTKGINVWCAAGKGTFGTTEIITRIKTTKLSEYVSHKKIIAPQLGAPGVKAHEVKKATGYRIYYGPVYAKDIPAYLNNGKKAAPNMRRVRFPAADRAILTPMELNMALRKAWAPLLIVLALFGLTPGGILFKPALRQGGPIVLAALGGVLTGTVVTPIALPLIPGRSFAWKGFLSGAVLAAALLYVEPADVFSSIWIQILVAVGVPALSSYLAFNFTGCTTFTSVAGVKKELKVAIPLYIVASAVALAMLGVHTVSRLIA